MRLKIGISPCPNDTYIFEGIAKGPLQLPDAKLDFEYHDIAVLNQKSLKHELDIVKLSYANYFQVAQDYVLLRSGGAMGYGVGPLLLSLDKDIRPHTSHHIAIPGKHTTANFLLRYAFPTLDNKTEVPFDQIENKLLAEEYDLGLVIHESRFTYQKKGLHKVMDLGTYWESKEKLPIPLGGIAIKRNLANQFGQAVNELIVQSINWQEEQTDLSTYIQGHAQEMDEAIMQEHIDLYVNDFSLDIGSDGEKATSFMQQLLLPEFKKNIFIS